MIPADIFNRDARRRHRGRMLNCDPDARWLMRHMSEDIVERLDAVRCKFSRALILGSDLGSLRECLSERGIISIVADASPAIATSEHGIVCDEDRLPFADHSFDLIIAIGTLSTVTDLPGALILIRRALTKDGLFLGTMMGVGSLPALRSSLDDPVAHQAVARFHPQVDVRSVGDLLERAGFLLPVAENEVISASYRTLDGLIKDLRANGLANVLTKRYPLTKGKLSQARKKFAKANLEQFSIIMLTGWGQSS